MNRQHSSGTTTMITNRRHTVLREGQVVAEGSAEAMEAAARLFGVSGVACVTPNGRTDSHGKFVKHGPGPEMVCMFCGDPV
jgi:hypothetical protein